MSKRQDIKIIRRELKVSFKEARRIYNQNGESLLDSLVIPPLRVEPIRTFNPVNISALRIYPRLIEERIPPEEISKDIARAMSNEISKYIQISKEVNEYRYQEPYITYRGDLKILVKEGGDYGS